MAEPNKWQIEGWGAAQRQISEAIEFLCDGKPAGDRAAIADELFPLVRSLARGNYPELQTSPFDRDEHARESWARMSAHIPNSWDEVRKPVKYFDIENLRQPNPFDDDPPGG